MTLRQIQNSHFETTVLMVFGSVFLLIIALIGISMFKRQWRRLSELRVTNSQKQHDYRQDDTVNTVRYGQSQSRQSRQELSTQLEDMKELQLDVKERLTDLQLLAKQFSKNKPKIRSTTSSDKSKYQKSD